MGGDGIVVSRRNCGGLGMKKSPHGCRVDTHSRATGSDLEGEETRGEAELVYLLSVGIYRTGRLGSRARRGRARRTFVCKSFIIFPRTGTDIPIWDGRTLLIPLRPTTSRTQCKWVWLLLDHSAVSRCMRRVLFRG